MTASNESASAAAGFFAALISDNPSPELAEMARDFGWLVGGWTAEVTDIDGDGRERRGEGEWWFAWVLEGRAIQDVWISPPRGKRGGLSDPAAADNRYGTTVRWLDRRGGLWRIVWVNPVTGVMSVLAGRREDDRIILLGEDSEGAFRWSFNDIRPDSFVWRGETRDPHGEWRLGTEFRLKRLA